MKLEFCLQSWKHCPFPLKRGTIPGRDCSFTLWTQQGIKNQEMNINQGQGGTHCSDVRALFSFIACAMALTPSSCNRFAAKLEAKYREMSVKTHSDPLHQLQSKSRGEHVGEERDSKMKLNGRELHTDPRACSVLYNMTYTCPVDLPSNSSRVQKWNKVFT